MMIKKMHSVVQYRKTLLQRKRLLWIQAYSEESLLIGYKDLGL